MINNNEETILNQNEQTVMNEETVMNQETETVQEEVAAENNEAKSRKGCGWAIVTIAGVSGVALGTASTLAAQTLHEVITENNNQSEEENQDQNQDTTNHTTNTAVHHSNVPMATSVNDDMSFAEAFAAARHEVGAGGAFVWHGGVYGTYYGSEWNQMSPEEQAQFTADAMGTPHQTTNHTAQQQNGGNSNGSNGEIAQHGNGENGEHGNGQNGGHENGGHENGGHENGGHENGGHENGGHENGGGEGIEIEVLGVEENVVFDDGTVGNIGYAEVDGHTAMFIDGDNNGSFDAVIIDVNDNGVADENDIAGTVNPDLGLSVDTFNEALNVAPTHDPTDDLYAQMPDYTNDANVSDLA